MCCKGGSELGRPGWVHFGDSQEPRRQRTGNRQEQRPVQSLTGTPGLTAPDSPFLLLLPSPPRGGVFKFMDIKETDYRFLFFFFLSSPSSPKLRELRGGGCQALSRLALDSHWNASRTAPPSSGSLRQSSCLWAEVHEASLHSEESWSPVPHLSPSTLCLFTLLATSSSLPFLRLSGPSCHHYYQRCNYYVPANDDPLAATLLKFCL